MAILKRLKARLLNDTNPFSKTQQATCAALPAGVVSFLCLINNDSAALEFVGYIFAALSAYLVWYKDKRDRA